MIELSPFENIKKILEGEYQKEQLTFPNTAFYQAISNITKKQHHSLKNIKDFFKQLNEDRNCMINIDNAMSQLSKIQFMVCIEKNLYSFSGERKGYAITGRALNVYRRTKKNHHELSEDREAREQLIADVEKAILKLYTQNKYPLSKWQKDFLLEDILLQYDLPGTNLEPVLVSNEVFTPFVVVQPTIVMTIPQKSIGKPENIEYLKASMLHVYIDNAALISRISTKLIMHKNSTLNGINFIEQGEVAVASGRIVARGWVTSGICKNSGTGWKFKPVSFLKFIAKNQNVWKQYLNDIKNNGEYPFAVNSILDLSQEGEESPISGSYKGYYKKNTVKFKLPKINSNTEPMYRSFDQKKYIEMENMRHYDKRIDDLFYYKKDLLNRKMKGKVYNQYEPLIENAEIEAAKKARLKRQMSKQRRDFSTVRRSIDGCQNILIMSVLKRLQALATDQQPEGRKQERQKTRLNSKSSIAKITPLQIYENQKKIAHNKRYHLLDRL